MNKIKTILMISIFAAGIPVFGYTLVDSVTLNCAEHENGGAYRGQPMDE